MANRENFHISRQQLNKFVKTSFDYNLLLILIFLLGFGLIMVYSASSYVALRDFGDQWHYFKGQLRADLIGLVALIVLIFVPYKFFNKYTWLKWTMFAVATFFPLMVIPFGVESHSAVRWIQVPGTSITFQPAEISKILFIMFMASWLQSTASKLSKLIPFLTTLALPVLACVLYFFVTDNLSSAIILFGICFVMTFIASKSYKRYILIVLVAAVIITVVVVVAMKSGGEGGDFRIARIAVWLHPESASDTTGHQTLQGLYAIGNGGIWGKGLGQSVQKISNLPEPHNDMIFDIICEELGIVGATALMVLFVLLIFRMYVIAKNTKDRYGFYLVCGVMTHIAIQVVLNIAVATNSMPNTGVSLPFISYGGTSALFLLSEMGLVFSVNRNNQIEAMKEQSQKRL